MRLLSVALMTFTTQVFAHGEVSSESDDSLPGFMQNLLHGAGPAEHKWDYIIAIVMLIITVLTLYLSIKWLVKPGEKSPKHIKRQILEENEDGQQK